MGSTRSSRSSRTRPTTSRLPFYRQQTLSQLLGISISASTVFNQCEHVANAAQPVMQYRIAQAADAVHYHLDDTSHRILSQGTVVKPDRKTGRLKERSGQYTSA